MMLVQKRITLTIAATSICLLSCAAQLSAQSDVGLSGTSGGAALGLFAGFGIFYDDPDDRAFYNRFGVQLSYTNPAKRPVEFVVDAYVSPAGLVGVSAGPNVLRERGTYYGVAVGAAAAAETGALNVAARIGHKPVGSLFRPELRLDLYRSKSQTSAAFTGTLVLEIH